MLATSLLQYTGLLNTYQPHVSTKPHIHCLFTTDVNMCMKTNYICKKVQL